VNKSSPEALLFPGFFYQMESIKRVPMAISYGEYGCRNDLPEMEKIIKKPPRKGGSLINHLA